MEWIDVPTQDLRRLSQIVFFAGYPWLPAKEDEGWEEMWPWAVFRVANRGIPYYGSFESVGVAMRTAELLVEEYVAVRIGDGDVIFAFHSAGAHFFQFEVVTSVPLSKKQLLAQYPQAIMI